MYWLHVTSLLLIAGTWLAAWRVGHRWCVGCGVVERISAAALGSIIPTAGLVAAVHVVGLLSLVTDRGCVAPAPVAVVFLLAMWVAHLLVRTLPANRDGFSVAVPEEVRQTGFPSRDREGAVCSEHRGLRFLTLDLAARRKGRAGAARNLRPVSHARTETQLTPGFLWLPVFIVLGMYAVFIVDAVTRHPTGYDGLKYHLPMAVSWMQSGKLDLVLGQMHRCLPDNAMMVPMLLAFGRLERLITLFNVPNTVLLAAAVYGLSRAIGVRRTGAVAAVCVAMSVPIIAFQSVSSYIDLYAAAAWLMSLLALVWTTRVPDDCGRRALLILAGLSAGVALGCKSTFLVLVPLLGLVAVITCWMRAATASAGMLGPIRRALWFGGAALVCSGFWFIRGAVETGNPIYPLGITVGGREFLAGYDAGDFFPRRSLAHKVERWWDYPWVETKYSGTGEIYSVNNGLGAAYATFVPLGLLCATFMSLRARAGRAEVRWRLIFVILVWAGPVLLVTLFHEVLRYVLPLVVLTVPLAAVLIERLLDRFPAFSTILLTAALSVTAAIAALSPAQAVLGRIRDGVWSRAAFYEIPEFVDELDSGTRILNLAAPPMTYPLAGRRLANDVISGAHWNAVCGGRLLSADTLREHEIDLIYVREPWPTDLPENLPVELIYDDTDTRRLATTPATRIYRVVRE